MVPDNSRQPFVINTPFIDAPDHANFVQSELARQRQSTDKLMRDKLKQVIDDVRTSQAPDAPKILKRELHLLDLEISEGTTVYDATQALYLSMRQAFPADEERTYTDNVNRVQQMLQATTEFIAPSSLVPNTNPVFSPEDTLTIVSSVLVAEEVPGTKNEDNISSVLRNPPPSIPPDTEPVPLPQPTNPVPNKEKEKPSSLVSSLLTSVSNHVPGEEEV